MGTTTTRAFRYPDPTDRVMDGATAIEHLAEDLETALVDSAWAAGGDTVQAGWSTQVERRKKNGLVYLYLQLTRTGAAIGPSGATGNIGDQTVTVLPAGWRPGRLVCLHWLVATATAGAGRIDPANGSVTVDALYPTASISTGDVIRAWASFPAEN